MSKSQKTYESYFWGPKYTAEVQTGVSVHQQNKLVTATKAELPLWMMIKPDSTKETLNSYI